MLSIRAGHAGLLAALCAAILSTAALAAQSVRDETTLLVRTSAGALERLKYEGDLADGERRALTTEAGNPATLSRVGTGLVLELAGERFDVKLPAVTIDADGEVDVGEVPGERRRVVIHRDEDHATDVGADGTRSETRKVVQVIRRGEAGPDPTGDADATTADVMALALDAAEPEILLLDGEGPKVVVLRRIVRADGSAP
jgi:hypothetical protein